MNRAYEEIVLNNLHSLSSASTSKIGLYFVGDGCGFDNFIICEDEINLECNGVISHFEDTSIHGARYFFDAYCKIFVINIPSYAEYHVENLIENIINDDRFIKLFYTYAKPDKTFKQLFRRDSNSPSYKYANIFLFSDFEENNPDNKKLGELLGELIYEINMRLPKECLKIDYEGSGVISYQRFCNKYSNNEINDFYKDGIDQALSELNLGYFNIDHNNQISYNRTERIGLSDPINSNSVLDINQILVRKNVFPDKDLADEFCDLLNSNVKENKLQKFIEKNPSLLNIFKQDCKIYPQIQLIDQRGKELRPDFMIQPLETGRSIILDLKLPNARLIKNKKNRISFYANINEYINQLRTYGKFFLSKANRRWFKDKYGFSIFEPELILMVGNAYEYYDYNIIRDLKNKDANDVHLLTYQQLIKDYPI